MQRVSRPRSLRFQVQTLTVVPILCLATVAVVASLLLTKRQVELEAQRNLQEVSSLLASSTRERGEALAVQTRLLADLASVHKALLARDLETVRDRTRYFSERTQADAVVVTDPSGRILARGGRAPINLVGPSVLTMIRNARAGRTEAGIVAQDGKLYNVTCAPIVEGKKLGAVTSFSSVGDELAFDLAKATSARVLLLWNGKVVGSSFPPKGLSKLPTKNRSNVDLNGERYVALSQPMPGAAEDLGVWIATLRSFDTLAQPYRALSTMFTVLLLVSLLVAVLLAGTFATGMTAPLSSLVKSAQVVRDGEWPEPFDVQREDEIGILQSVFNDMMVALRESRERIFSLVDTDPLTGLDNHRRFKERLDQEVFRACMSHKPLVLALVDFDKFAEYNAKFGHTAGDEALCIMGKLLSEVAPDIAFLARYGGEEFAMLLPLNTLEAIEPILDRLRELATDRFLGPLTFSIGVADVKPGITTGAGLLLSAEMALSRSKQLGRNRTCRFDAVPGAANTEDPFQLQEYLQDTTLSTIQALAGAVDAKDSYTQGHSVRVARYACDLARYMGYPAHYVDLVYKTGTLHDVGKIGVPDSVLSKPARLEPEEQAIMETHAVLGELIVKKAPQLQDMLPGVRHHHERWDGDGYPDRLMGTQIPLLARLIAVADTFDAMTSDRPYRKALPEDVALDEIRRKAGTQFDPELAEAFVRMMRLNTHGRIAA